MGCRLQSGVLCKCETWCLGELIGGYNLSWAVKEGFLEEVIVN